MNNLWRMYIKPFDDAGVYTDWIEVTDDVDFGAIGSIAQDLDNTDYDIGVYRNSNFKLTLNNASGRYSDVGNQTSIFRFKRADSLVKLTWQQGVAPMVGLAIAGDAVLTEETDIFVGLLNDDTAEMSLKSQKISFSVLGRESVFLRTIVPFGTVSNGDMLEDVIYNCLNQSKITSILSLDPGNISVGLNQANDSIASLQNKTVQEALNGLLLATNSVLYIENDSIFVQPRTESADFRFNFYGQGSNNGPENVSLIDNIRTGIAKVFNFFAWDDSENPTTLSVTNSDSTLLYGVRKKTLSFKFLTNDTKRQNIMEALNDEFSLPKQEFSLQTPLNHDSLQLGLLDKVSIDYPTVYLDQDLPVCGVAVCGLADLPVAKWAFQIDPLDGYKVMGRSINVKNSSINFRMRAIA